MTNLISHAAGIIEDKAATAVVWTGAGVAIAKAISCAEILKRQYSIQHQVTKLAYKRYILINIYSVSCFFTLAYQSRVMKITQI